MKNLNSLKSAYAHYLGDLKSNMTANEANEGKAPYHNQRHPEYSTFASNLIIRFEGMPRVEDKKLLFIHLFLNYLLMH